MTPSEEQQRLDGDELVAQLRVERLVSKRRAHRCVNGKDAGRDEQLGADVTVPARQPAQHDRGEEKTETNKHGAGW